MPKPNPAVNENLRTSILVCLRLFNTDFVLQNFPRQEIAEAFSNLLVPVSTLDSLTFQKLFNEYIIPGLKASEYYLKEGKLMTYQGALMMKKANRGIK